MLQDRIVAGVKCHTVGNQFLLDVPDKKEVVFHRAYTEAELAREHALCMACGQRGGVLVSAAIAEWEKGVMHEAMERGFSLIWLRSNGFHDYYKPSGRAFDACAQGRLLEISPWPYSTQRTTITREQCLFLNKIALGIAGG